MLHCESFQQLCRFFKRWSEDVLSCYVEERGSTVAVYKEVNGFGDGLNGLPVADVRCTEGQVLVEMRLYGPNVARCPPRDEEVCFTIFHVANFPSPSAVDTPCIFTCTICRLYM